MLNFASLPHIGPHRDDLLRLESGDLEEQTCITSIIMTRLLAA